MERAAFPFPGIRTTADGSEAVCREVGGNFDGNIYWGASSVRVGVYAIGTDPDTFKRWANSADSIRYGNRVRQSVRNRRIVLGVDRLDYTKGIPERLMAFEQLLERYPFWHGRVSMIQISAQLQLVLLPSEGVPK